MSGIGESILDTWHGLVAQKPDALAVIDCGSGRAWSRAQLAAAANQWIASFSAAEKKSLSRRCVVMAEPNGAQWFQVFLGLLEAGAVPALADSKEAPERLAIISDACRAVAIWRGGTLTLREPKARLRRADLCLAKLTSGSTGISRTLMFTHGQMLADGRQIARAMGIGADDINLAVIPLGHSYGLGNLVVPLLEQGTPVLCASSPFPQVVAGECAQWKATVFPAVPMLLRALAAAEVAPEKLASLRLITSAGAPLLSAEASAFAKKFGKHIHNFYGTSETGGIAFDYEGGAAESTGHGVGRPIEGVRLVWRRGKRFAVESAAVHGRGRYSPPDKGEINTAGELVLLGRAGRMLKIAGRRLNPVEVEDALRAIPGVNDAFVAAHPLHPDTVAAVIAGSGRQMPLMELRQRLMGRLAPWKIPHSFHFVDAFPMTQRGKTDRQALLRLLA